MTVERHGDCAVPWSFALSALAVYRLTRLATLDDITAGPRDHFIRAVYVSVGRESEALTEIMRQTDPSFPNAWTRHAMDDNDPPKLATLASCRFCASIWVASGAVLLRWTWPRGWRTLSEILSLASVGVLLARLEEN